MNRLGAVIIAGCLAMASCLPTKMDAYEKNQEIPGHQWTYQYKPVFEVTVNPEDTAYLYNIYVNVRHTDAYPYSNIWVLVNTQTPGDTTQQPRRVELPLADASGKWLGRGLDDIYEHRIPIQEKAILNKPGTYRFIFEQNMRQNPLPYVMNVGLRIEKAGQRP
ncbi:MAG TPA: gliding motility lipoprotein GldH [Chitinophaga sp.]